MTALTTLEADRAAALDAMERSGRVDDDFLTRFDAQFPRLHDLFARLYGGRADGQEQLALLAAEASSAWNARPLELKVRDEQRLADPEWFASERALGGVCYVDRFAGNLAGIRDQIPYFRELGLSYLHLMPLFDAPEGDNDGGYAVSSYRRVESESRHDRRSSPSSPRTSGRPGSRSSSTSSSTTRAMSTTGRARQSPVTPPTRTST